MTSLFGFWVWTGSRPALLDNLMIRVGESPSLSSGIDDSASGRVGVEAIILGASSVAWACIIIKKLPIPAGPGQQRAG